MPTRPDAPGAGLEATLARFRRRAWHADILMGASSGATAAAVVTMVGRWQGWARPVVAAVLVLLGVMAVVIWRRGRQRTDAAIAARVERSHRDLRNLLVTAVELRGGRPDVSEWIRARVLDDASAASAGVGSGAVDGLRRPAVLLALGLAAWTAVAAGIPMRGAAVARQIGQAAARVVGLAGPPGLEIVARLAPPSYTGQAPSEVRNPERLEAVQGTALRLTIAGNRGLRARYSGRALETTADGTGVVIASMVLEESGYVAIDRASGEGGEATRLIPVLVTPDRAPVVRIEAPGRDLLVADASKPLPVAATASDDLALDSLELRYTKVSGSGEQFEFEEGRLPLSLRRSSERAWDGRGTLDLGALNLAPGDTLVYRAVARDRRPAEAGIAASDTFYVEVQGPGQVPLEGIDMLPEQERYALSQQMVLLKIQRLRERERTMAPSAIAEEAAAIAAEQRAVRANFIFLMGGHVEDEFEEAEQSHEIQEGRLENTARRDISRAISHMSQAERGLSAADTGRALPPARAAVEALQRAFGHNRYILRTLSTRSRIDPARRLSGGLEDAAGWRRELIPAGADPRAAAVEQLLGALVALAAPLSDGQPLDARATATLAERALAIDPESPVWRKVSGDLNTVHQAVTTRRPPAEIARLLNEATAPVVEAARGTARGLATDATARPGALRGAWADEVRR
jgi:hypothetical protein